MHYGVLGAVSSTIEPTSTYFLYIFVVVSTGLEGKTRDLGDRDREKGLETYNTGHGCSICCT